EGDQGNSQADIDQLRVGVAGCLDLGEDLVADCTAGPYESADQTSERIPFGIAGRLAGAKVLQDIRLEASHLAEHHVSGETVVTSCQLAHDELDRLLLLLAEAAGSESAFGLEDGLQRGGAVAARGGQRIGGTAPGLPA